MEIENIDSLPFFFIVGRQRSGTTLLQSLLNAHPNVVVPIESTFIMSLYSNYASIKTWDKKIVRAFCDDLGLIPSLHAWHIKKEDLFNLAIQIKNPSYSSLCKAVFLCYHEALQKNKIMLIGDKNPGNSLFLHELGRLFPVAKFIWIVRDYRAQINSMLKVNFEAHIISSLAARWKDVNKEIVRYQSIYPDKIMLVKYEDFVREQEAWFQKTCDFLKIEYTDIVFSKRVEMSKHNSYYLDEYFTSIKKPITNELSYAWKKEMDKKLIRTAEHITGAFGLKFGYKQLYKKRAFYFYPCYLPGILFGKLYKIYLRTLYKLPLKLQLYIFWKLIVPNFKFPGNILKKNLLNKVTK